MRTKVNQIYPPFQPRQYQKPVDGSLKIKPLLKEIPDDSLMDVDMLFVGAGPAGLSGAIRLKQLCQKDFPDISIGVIEKASRIGGHSLSGAVINPVAFKELFPDLKESDLPFRQEVKKEKLFYLTAKGKYPLPLPPTMKNKGFYTTSLCETLRWMAEKAEAMDISIFTSFTANELLTENDTIKGISTFPSGLNKDGSPSSSYQPPIFIRSKLTILADGSRGHLSQAWMKWKNISSKYPQTYALGVKELWEVSDSSSQIIKQQIWHTMGWPLSMDCFGGAWVYDMGDQLVSLGLVAGLDSPLQDLDVHNKLQELKNHPLLSKLLKDGKCVEWGAKTIPEGGYHSIPQQLYDDGLLIAGDAASMVNVPALKGIHYAMTSGLLCAEAAFLALKADDFSSKTLKVYDEQIRKNSCIRKELYPVRNVRQAFDKNIVSGLIKSGLMFLTKGKFPGDYKKTLQPDDLKIKTRKSKKKGSHGKIIPPGYKLAFLQTITKFKGLTAKKKGSHGKVIPPGYISKTEGVFLSGNKTRDDIPSHLRAKEDLPEEIQKFYTALCPAGVYEQKDGKLIINAPNCVDCKATDILGPEWTPKEGGTGPNYTRM
ncbi:MAG: electron-transfer flavoprotein:ubiquinone oxidoreductase [Bdellovibrionales bacterium]|nr:electron-transfer flavoprotein:ubiquinone oxidoreductase [Bdellovibrionales bacterium]